MWRANTICLVGLMGSGKTTVGRLLAKKMGAVFFDSDHEIEHRTRVSIPTIFEIEGEKGFRQRESEVVVELLRRGGCVLATGGGAVLNEATRSALHACAWTVYLDVPARLLYERTRHDTNRPLLQVKNPLARLEALRVERDPIYRDVADFVLDGERYHSGAAASRILKEWQKCTGN